MIEDTELTSYWSTSNEWKKSCGRTKNKDGGLVGFIQSLFPEEESSFSTMCCLQSTGRAFVILAARLPGCLSLSLFLIDTRSIALLNHLAFFLVVV